MKRIVVAVLACLAVSVFALSGCSGGSGAQDVKSMWVGTWELHEMTSSDQSVTAEQAEALRSLGMDIYLELNEDGGMKHVSGEDTASGTWEAESATAGSIVVNGAETEMSLQSGVLSMTAGNTTMSFVKGDARQSASSGASKASSSASSAASAQAQTKKEPTLGSTITFKGLEITFGDSVSTTVLSNQFSEHNGATVIAVPVSITNKASGTQGLNMFGVKEYGSKGTELERVFTYFDDDARMAGDMRSGATMDANLYFLYDGDGDYYLTFGNYSTDTEVKIPVQL